MNKGIMRNGITIGVRMLPNKKLPSLTVQLEGEPCRIYKVATFNSKENANWFEEIAEELLKGLTVEMDGGT